MEQIELMMTVFGAFDENIKLIERELDVSIVSRGSELKITGEEAAAELAELRAKSDEKAKEDARQLASDTENRKAAMRARADARLEKAAALIVERVVNG